MISMQRAETAKDLAEARTIQLAVFSQEQGIPEDLCLQNNDAAIHVLAVDGEQYVGTARMLDLGNRHAELARIAVVQSHRGSGLGAQLIRKLEEIAVLEGFENLVLHPHQYLENFYARLGYVVGEEGAETVGGHALITMSKELTK
jgi:predicted GNAT family N-acyltransferase